MESFSWHCPYCAHDTTIVVRNNYHRDYTNLEIENADGKRRLTSEFIVCPNSKCKKFTLTLYLQSIKIGATGHYETNKVLRRWNLIPSSDAKVFPDYVPKPIIEDYEEACAIKNLSPKASATLARRCLQGMIRDFWSVKVKHGNLAKEIEAIEDKIDPQTLASIDAIRKIGNIGAHMEEDIDHIVEVAPEEASLLIELIELLIAEWYIHRFERNQRNQEIVRLALSKKEQKTQKSENQ